MRNSRIRRTRVTAIAITLAVIASILVVIDRAQADTEELYSLGDPVVISLSDVVTQVSSSDFTVLENALKVYQAKESIQVARRNLLPKLNLWRILSIPLDPKSAAGAFVGSIEDIAPFLVPNNWFRVKEEVLFAEAQTQAYRALWANEVMTAKALYLHALIDESLLNHVKKAQEELARILDIVRVRESLGGMHEGTSKDIQVRILALEEDERALNVIIREDKTLLAMMTGHPGNSDVTLLPVAMPKFEGLKPLEYDDFEFRALDSSPETKQFDSLIAAAEYVKKERIFSFLGSSALSHGAAGGVFDGLPAQDGLGFGTSASVRIVKAQKKILELQKAGVTEVVRRNLKLLVENYNLDLESYANIKKRVELTNAIDQRLYERLRMGDPVESIELIEASRNHIEADTAFFAVQYRFLTNEDRLSRLLFANDYDRSLTEVRP